MALGIIAVVALIFAWRGYSMGLANWCIKIIAILVGGVTAVTYREQLSLLLAPRLPVKLPDELLGLIAGFVLFVIAVFVANILGRLLVSLFSTYILDHDSGSLVGNRKDSIRTKIAGAMLNGTLGALLGVMVVWGFGLVLMYYVPSHRLLVEDKLLSKVTHTINGLVLHAIREPLQQVGINVTTGEDGRPTIEKIENTTTLEKLTRLQRAIGDLTGRGSVIPDPRQGQRAPQVGNILNADGSVKSNSQYQLIEPVLLETLDQMHSGRHDDGAMRAAVDQLSSAGRAVAPADAEQMAQLSKDMLKAAVELQNSQLVKAFSDPELVALVQKGDTQALLQHPNFKALIPESEPGNGAALANLLIMMGKAKQLISSQPTATSPNGNGQ